MDFRAGSQSEEVLNNMPRTCTICSHKDIDEIDRRARIENDIAKIAKEFSISYPALYRHILADHHIRAVTAIPTSAELATSGDILKEITDHHKEAVRLKGLAEDNGDFRTALLGLDKALKCLDLMARIQGQIQEQNINVNTQVNILQAPEWITLRTLIITTLDRFPEAKEALSKVLP
jgi:hypothetical protein